MLQVGEHVFDLAEAVIIAQVIPDRPECGAANLLDGLANCGNPVGVHHLIDRKLALPDIEGEMTFNRARAQFPEFGDLFNRLALPEKRETLLAGSGIVFLPEEIPAELFR